MNSVGGARSVHFARMQRLATVTLVVAAFALVAAGMIVVIAAPGWFPPDANTYRAAAERLNAGHDLYRLVAGDRPMFLYSSVPFLSPPPIAVAWRPMALLGDASLYLWWGGCVAAIFAALVLLARRRPVETSVAMIVLFIPLALVLGWSNVDGYLFLMLVGTWLAARSGHDLAAGGLVATMVAIKLTPLPLALWFLAIGRYRAFAACVGFAVLWLAVSLAGAGLDAHIRYFGVIRDTFGSGTTDLSLAGLGRAVGLPTAVASALPFAWWLACGAAILALRRRPGAAYVAAVVMLVLGSPVVQPYTLVLLVALIAPLAWPWSSGRAAAASSAGESRVVQPTTAGP